MDLASHRFDTLKLFCINNAGVSSFRDKNIATHHALLKNYFRSGLKIMRNENIIYIMIILLTDI